MHMNSTQGVPAVASLALLLLAATGCSEGGASPTVTEEASYSSTPAETSSATPVAAQKSAAPNQKSLAATGPGANAVTTRPAKKPITPRAIATPANPDTFAIKLDPTTLELGQIPTKETVEGIVKLVNTGDEPMTVVDAKTSCGCTTANVPTAAKPRMGTRSKRTATTSAKV